MGSAGAHTDARFTVRTARSNSSATSRRLRQSHGARSITGADDLVTATPTGNNTYFGPRIQRPYRYPEKAFGLKEFGTGLRVRVPARILSTHFPKAFQDNFLNCNVIAFWHFPREVKEEGSGLWRNCSNLRSCSRRPNSADRGWDVAPMVRFILSTGQNPIIGHMSTTADPNRDHSMPHLPHHL